MDTSNSKTPLFDAEVALFEVALEYATDHGPHELTRLVQRVKQLVADFDREAETAARHRRNTFEKHTTVGKLYAMRLWLKEPISVSSPAFVGVVDDADTLLDLLADTTDSPDDVMQRVATKKHIEEFLSSNALEKREMLIIRARFGLECDEFTLEAIGELYGVTRERIRQIEKKALLRMRAFFRRKGLYARDML